MSINIQIEKSINLTSQQIYDICDFATQAAYDDGFMNSYIFERALYVFLAIQLFEDEEIKEHGERSEKRFLLYKFFSILYM